MAKKIKTKVKIQIAAGAATPAPPVGPMLAPQGINIAEFCKAFNEATRASAGFNIPAVVTIYEDRTYSFVVKQPPAGELILKATGIAKGSGTPNKKKAGKVTKDQLREIAKRKMVDFNTDDVEQAIKVLAGTAKNMGIEVIGE